MSLYIRACCPLEYNYCSVHAASWEKRNATRTADVVKKKPVSSMIIYYIIVSPVRRSSCKRVGRRRRFCVNRCIVQPTSSINRTHQTVRWNLLLLKKKKPLLYRALLIDGKTSAYTASTSGSSQKIVGFVRSPATTVRLSRWIFNYYKTDDSFWN